METAPTRGFPNFTRSNGGNSETFNEGPGGFLSLSNPFTITDTKEWTVSIYILVTEISLLLNFLHIVQGRIQFFIDALDKAAQDGEIEVLINHFPIDLELELGAAFTERATYTGVYNISGLEFDMSFGVQCSENYYGPNCITFCEPMEGVYTCISEGIPVCLRGNQNFCTQCLSSWNPSLNCAMCLDPSTSCTTCRNRRFDPSSNCTSCLGFMDPQTKCTKCLPDFIEMGNSCSRITTEIIDLMGEVCKEAYFHAPLL